MKITTRQLRRIIKEEKRKMLRRKILREGSVQEDALFIAMDDYVSSLDEEMGYDIPLDRLKSEVLGFVEEFFKQLAYSQGEDY